MKELLIHYLPTIQVVISVLLIISILLQQTGAAVGAGAAFGGGSGNIKHTRRGAEKFLLKFTTFLAILFFLTSVANIVLK